MSNLLPLLCPSLILNVTAPCQMNSSITCSKARLTSLRDLERLDADKVFVDGVSGNNISGTATDRRPYIRLHYIMAYLKRKQYTCCNLSSVKGTSFRSAGVAPCRGSATSFLVQMLQNYALVHSPYLPIACALRRSGSVCP